jgi:hypothetical protein
MLMYMSMASSSPYFSSRAAVSSNPCNAHWSSLTPMIFGKPVSEAPVAGDGGGANRNTALPFPKWTEPTCQIAPATLISFNAVNTASDFSTFVPTPITKNQVRFIVNGGVAQSIFGVPFGNAARNSLRDAKTNSFNIGVYKDFKFWERAVLQWHMTMLNAFNHPNFSSVDPFLDDAGFASEGTGFANPLLFSGGTAASGSGSGLPSSSAFYPNGCFRGPGEFLARAAFFGADGNRSCSRSPAVFSIRRI